MADYYPLIARAVAGLDKNTGDARRSLYERARNALVTQLRSVTPALNESDITRERLALEEAIRKVEGEATRKSRSEALRDAAVKVRAPNAARWEAAGRWEEPASTAEPMTSPARPQPAPALRPELPPRSSGPAQDLGETRLRPASGMSGGEQSQSHSAFDRPTETAEAPASPPPASTRPIRARMPTAEHPSLLDAGLQDFHGVVSETDDLDEAALPLRAARDPYDTVAAQPTDLDQHQLRTFDRPETDHAPRAYDEGPDVEPMDGADMARPFPPNRRGIAGEEAAERQAPQRSYRDLIRAGIALVLLGIVSGALASQWPRMVSFYHSLRAPAATAVATATPSPPQPSSKFPDRIEPGSQTQQQAALPPPNPTPKAAGPAVAQRVVLYEEDPPNPEVKRYAGSAIWRTEMISPGAGHPPELAIRADVEIPERGITMTWSLRRNTDPSLPASHTVEIMFKLPKDFGPGGIANVPGMLMKQGEEARGIPIAGMAVKVTNGYFLIGLSAVEADKDRNIQLLKERPWFDIMLVYNNNRRAILAIEKGAPGEAVFKEAFAAWSKQG
jgi:hypothetical protein